MTVRPRWRLAALAVWLSVAMCVAAAGSCTTSTVQMELVGVDSGLETHELPRCLSSFTLNLDTSCGVSLTATAPATTFPSYVPAMWSSDANVYKQFKPCPTASSKPFSSLMAALQGFVYGTDAQGAALKPTVMVGTALTEGRLEVVITNTPTKKSLVWAFRATTGDPTTLAVQYVPAGTAPYNIPYGMTAGVEYISSATPSQPCGAGRYPVTSSSGLKLCPLCPAGTTGDGTGCKACAAGTASGVPGLSSSCTQCAAGTYAPAGSSTCLPCPQHTFSGAGASQCTPCPVGTYAWVPGSTVCVRCTDGVAHLHTEDASLPAASAGSAILRFPNKLGTACDSLASAFPIPALSACTTWKAGTKAGPPDLKLALEVAGDCSINIKPVGDGFCADAGAVAGQAMPLPLSGTYSYTYSNLTMRAYYTGTNRVRMLLPPGDGGASSFIMHIDNTSGSTTAVDLWISAATNKTVDASLPGSLYCSLTAAVDGGNVAGASAACGAGSYKVANSCYACPQGSTCAGGTAAKTTCATDYANPYLGQSTGCVSCNSGTSMVTSLAGSAYCTIPQCRPSSLTMELVSVNLHSNLNKCLPTAVVSLDASCKYSIKAPAADNNPLVSWWATSNVDTYLELKLCPASSAKVSSLQLAFDSFVYGLNAAGTAAVIPASPSASVTGVTFPSPGKMVVTFNGNPSTTLVYAIRSTTGNTSGIDANAVVSSGAGFTAGTEFKDAATAGLPCAAGRYGVRVGAIKLCPLCPAGTTGSNGFSCKACPAGTASDKAGWTSSCTTCGAGTYAQEGMSNCQRCPPHTYSGVGASDCTPCPDDTYAWLPGSTECMRCAGGMATPHTAGTLPAPSEGNAILKFAAKLGNGCDSLMVGFPIPAVTACKSWRDGTKDGSSPPDLKLALQVADDCSVTIRPVSDKTCADLGANAGVDALFPRTNGANGLDANGKYSYSYNDLTIRAFYTASNKIRTLLPSSLGGATSFMLNIDPKTASSVRLQFYAATNKPSDSDSVLQSNACSHEATVEGGSVTGINVVPCGPGSYLENGCKPCPQGQTCAGDAAAPADCPADTANPYLGQSAGACTTCGHDVTKFTSLSGDAYCTLPFNDRQCAEGQYKPGGYEWDEHAGACVKCRPGTYRSTAMISDGTPDCQECPAGFYSGEGAASCTVCPTGQHSPTTGLADQEEGGNGIHCLLCPTGSIALAPGETMNTTATIGANDFRNERPLSTGATYCDNCPAGTWANATLTEAITNAKGCSLCPQWTYRSGDAAPENNECRQIAPGYKAAATILDPTNKIGAPDTELCSAGEVSFWSGSPAQRTPKDATLCKPCDKNSGTAAPRAGMAACTACKGGFYPNQQHSACLQCAPGTYRSYYTAADSCAPCPAGSEIGTSGRTACTKCRKGYFKTTAGTNDTCTPCPRNKFQNTTGATSACIWCPAGTETLSTGNSECSACPVGFYNPQAAASSAARACIAAPAGTFVNTTGASVATECPLGTFNDDSAQTACEPCPPGQYASSMGSQACKTCPAGTYSGGQASACKVCQAGYSAPTGSGTCSPCKAGTYASSPRSGTCTLCPIGKQCATPATVAPKDCPAGSFAPKEGSTLCTPCPVNMFAGAAGSNKCQSCPAGTNTRGLTGQKSCQAVAAPAGRRRSVLWRP